MLGVAVATLVQGVSVVAGGQQGQHPAVGEPRVGIGGQEHDRLPARVALLGVVDLGAAGQARAGKPKRWAGVPHGWPPMPRPALRWPGYRSSPRPRWCSPGGTRPPPDGSAPARWAGWNVGVDAEEIGRVVVILEGGQPRRGVAVGGLDPGGALVGEEVRELTPLLWGRSASQPSRDPVRAARRRDPTAPTPADQAELEARSRAAPTAVASGSTRLIAPPIAQPLISENGDVASTGQATRRTSITSSERPAAAATASSSGCRAGAPPSSRTGRPRTASGARGRPAGVPTAPQRCDRPLPLGDVAGPHQHSPTTGVP